VQEIRVEKDIFTDEFCHTRMPFPYFRVCERA
jgi:hypothetical protein